MKSMFETKERVIVQLFIFGAISFVGGALLTFLGFVMGSSIFFALGPFLILVAICMVGGALYLGFNHNQTMSAGAPRPVQEGRVVARYAINDIGEMIFDNYDYDAEDARFYVRIQYLDGKREELECARAVFDQCGEGMRGMLTMHGGWLSQFQALPDTEDTKAAYREW